jgi:hypothetical protein
MPRRERSDPTVEDIEWFFCQAESELGVKSNLGSVLERVKLGIDSGRSVQTDDAMIGRLQSTERYRAIYNRIVQVPTKYRKVLEVAYEERAVPVSLRLTFDRAAGVAVSMPLARRAYRSAMDKSPSQAKPTLAEWLARSVVLGTKTDREVVAVIRERATRLLEDAYSAYRRTA